MHDTIHKQLHVSAHLCQIKYIFTHTFIISTNDQENKNVVGRKSLARNHCLNGPLSGWILLLRWRIVKIEIITRMEVTSGQTTLSVGHCWDGDDQSVIKTAPL